MIDIDFATELLGYTGSSATTVAWRPELVRGADHDYVLRRNIADTVTATDLRIPIADLSEHLVALRAALAAGPQSAPATTSPATSPTTTTKA
jgi:hypothetical protein